MEEIIKAILSIMTGQCGIAALAPTLIAGYAIWQLNLERRGREHDRRIYMSEASKTISDLMDSQDKLHFYMSQMKAR